MYEENAMMNWDWKKVVKVCVAVMVILYLIKAIYSVFTANDDRHKVSDMIARQQAQFKTLSDASEHDIKKVQDGMANGAKEMENHAKEFENKMEDFSRDFSQSLNEEIARREKRRKDDFTYSFLEDHVRFYDADVYEADRKKAMDKTHYPLPNYRDYSSLREMAMYCTMQARNQFEEKIYRNKIAELKAANREKLIRQVEKPDVWKWPLTLEQTAQIRTDRFNSIFVLLTPEGRCRNA